MSEPASPLGRYGPSASEQDDVYEVRLIGVPVPLMARSRERHDELMREFSLLALSDPSHRADLPRRLVELIETLGVRYGAASARPDEVIEAAIAARRETVDLTYQVPASVVDAADRLEQLLAEADEYCRSEQLLTLPRDEAVRRLGAWYLGEFRRQVAGEPPLPWDGGSS